MIRLYRASYKDFGPTLASDKLLDRDGVRISDETLRAWLIEAGDWKRVRKSGRHRQWRERKGHRGEMVQIDGSHHAWFEDRGDPRVLIGYIDNATGDAFGRFYDYEGTMPNNPLSRKGGRLISLQLITPRGGSRSRTPIMTEKDS